METDLTVDNNSRKSVEIEKILRTSKMIYKETQKKFKLIENNHIKNSNQQYI